MSILAVLHSSNAQPTGHHCGFPPFSDGGFHYSASVQIRPIWPGSYHPLERTEHTICPVTALLGYLARRGNHPGPLFIFQDGNTLSKERLLERIQQALTSRGMDATGLKGHSFRIGAATAAALAGIEYSLIQTLGHWHSDAFLRYIRSPPHVLARATTRLLQQGPHLLTSPLQEQQREQPRNP